jgi:gliding motility-associated-like protein
VSIELDCPETANVSVWVHPSPESSFSLSAVDGCGPPAEVNTINQSQSAVSHEWRWENNVSSEIAPSLAFADTGLKIISLKVLNVLGCPDSSSAEYKVFGQPEIDFDLLPASGCPPLEVQFENQTQYADSVSWGFGDGNFAEEYSSSHVYENTGFFPLQVYMSTGNGRCWADSMIAQAVEVYPTPQAGFTVNPKIVSEESPTFTFDNNSQNYSGLYFYFDSLLVPEGFSTMLTLSEPDTGSHSFSMVVVNDYGCRDSSSETVFIKPDPTHFMPNSFSPDGDGVNDRFKIYFDKRPEVFWVTIYNRWGELIYFSNDPDEGWDGTYLGSKVESEVYVLKFSAIIEGTLVASKLFHNIVLIR